MSCSRKTWRYLICALVVGSLVVYLTSFHIPSSAVLVGQWWSTGSASNEWVNEVEQLGCYQLRSKDFFSGIPPSTSDAARCMELCHTVFSYYSKHRCLCSDLFDVDVALAERDCVTTDHAVLVTKARNATGLLVANYLAKRACHCTSPGCYRISCQVSTHTGPDCWSGPKPRDLHSYRTNIQLCSDNEYLVLDSNMSNGVIQFESLHTSQSDLRFCIPKSEMFGFWPLSNCKAFLEEDYIQHNNPSRLYQIRDQLPKTGAVSIYTWPRPNRTLIHIAGYYRSGSSFVSELFRNHPDAFFMFEPFISIVPNNLSHVAVRNDSYLINAVADSIDRLFNCKIRDIPWYAFNRNRQADLLTGVCSKSQSIDCMSLISSRCYNDKITVVKSIRVRMASVKEVLQTRLPDIKVILLLRDPRGVLGSRTFIGNTIFTGVTSKPNLLAKHAKDLCDTMLADYLIAKELMATHEGQVVFVHYEDIAKNKRLAAHYIYRVVGLGDPPAAILEQLGQLEKEEQIDISRLTYSTHRKNSLATAYSWKKRLKYSQVKIIDKACAAAYHSMGYLVIQSADELADPSNYHRTFNDFSNTYSMPTN